MARRAASPGLRSQSPDSSLGSSSTDPNEVINVEEDDILLGPQTIYKERNRWGKLDALGIMGGHPWQYRLFFLTKGGELSYFIMDGDTEVANAGQGKRKPRGCINLAKTRFEFHRDLKFEGAPEQAGQHTIQISPAGEEKWKLCFDHGSQHEEWCNAIEKFIHVADKTAMPTGNRVSVMPGGDVSFGVGSRAGSPTLSSASPSASTAHANKSMSSPIVTTHKSSKSIGSPNRSSPSTSLATPPNALALAASRTVTPVSAAPAPVLATAAGGGSSSKNNNTSTSTSASTSTKKPHGLKVAKAKSVFSLQLLELVLVLVALDVLLWLLLSKIAHSSSMATYAAGFIGVAAGGAGGSHSGACGTGTGTGTGAGSSGSPSFGSSSASVASSETHEGGSSHAAQSHSHSQSQSGSHSSSDQSQGAGVASSSSSSSSLLSSSSSSFPSPSLGSLLLQPPFVLAMLLFLINLLVAWALRKRAQHSSRLQAQLDKQDVALSEAKAATAAASAASARATAAAAGAAGAALPSARSFLAENGAGALSAMSTPGEGAGVNNTGAGGTTHDALSGKPIAGRTFEQVSQSVSQCRECMGVRGVRGVHGALGRPEGLSTSLLSSHPAHSTLH